MAQQPHQGTTGWVLPVIFDDLENLGPVPTDCADWPLDQPHSAGGGSAALQSVQMNLRAAATHSPWIWPNQPLVFISDAHADAEGFLRSLVASGTIRRFGSGLRDFALTSFGREAQIVIGGDCLDKGPSNLDLLDAIDALFGCGADVCLLAGNHDIRLVVALAALTGPRDPLTEHLFVRMARKAVPLLAEILDRHDVFAAAPVPDEATCRARLYPGADWALNFARAAKGVISDAAIEAEVSKLAKKAACFDLALARSGMTCRQAYAAALHCRRLFLDSGGAYRWFYDRMDVIKRSGSILFVHAGISDRLCDAPRGEGIDEINNSFLDAALCDPFTFYFGEVANLVRTKYRPTDRKLTDAGVQKLFAAGIKMVVQGHVNNHAGQRLLVKSGLLHLEADITLDRTSRRSEGLQGIGVGATLVYPNGNIVGLSGDYPKAKLFRPDTLAGN